MRKHIRFFALGLAVIATGAILAWILTAAVVGILWLLYKWPLWVLGISAGIVFIYLVGRDIGKSYDAERDKEEKPSSEPPMK